LKRLEADERRLVVEGRLQQGDLRLQQIALRLRHEEARGQADFVPPLLGLEPLLGKRRTGTGRVLALRRAAELTGRLTDGPGDIELQARDASVRLPTLDTRADLAHLLEAAAKRIADGDAEAPHRIALFEHLPEHIAEPGIDAAADHAGKSAG